MEMLHIVLAILVTIPTFLLFIVSILYFHYGIDGWDDMIREFNILKFKFSFGWSQVRIQRRKVNYIKTWKHSVDKFGDLVFLEKGRSTYTYNEIDDLSNGVGKFLYEKGVADGSVVGIMMTNSVEFIVSWLAIIKLGGRPALFNTNLRGTSMVHCLRSLTDCNYLLLNVEAKAQLDRETPIDFKLLRITVFLADLWSKDIGNTIIGERVMSMMKMISDEEAPGKWAGDNKAHDAIVGYLFTSGTTGFPKAVPMAFNRLWSVLQVALINRYNITQDDKMFSSLPLYHSTALCIGLHITILSGGRYIIKEKFSVQTFWSDLRAHEATIFLYVGEMCRFLLNRKTSFQPKVEYQTRLALGNGLGKDIYTPFKETFKIPQIAEFYGQTECLAFLGSVLNKPGSLGYIPKIKLGPQPYRVIQCDTETLQPKRDYPTGLCKLCNMNQAGLLIVKSENFGNRTIYHKSNQDVRFLSDVEKKGDEFINTGDLVMIGTDRSYYFVDRLGDTFRWKGENVATQEVASCINKLASVHEACVYGVTIPGHNGRAGMAAIVVDSEDTFSLEALYETLSSNLPSYAVPIFVRMVHSLETTATFKYKTNQLKQDNYDMSVISGNLYLVNHSQRTYEIMTLETNDLIKKGEIKLN
ncbi:long-chain fatty acid transport protein 4-like [Bolinopsis microptera]|uniref:long-chain fatty acid transport protein 4-like n=1 Tax=Bolinopsis microptera TaxID=2820187 RepID=UPI00307A6A60